MDLQQQERPAVDADGPRLPRHSRHPSDSPRSPWQVVQRVASVVAVSATFVANVVTSQIHVPQVWFFRLVGVLVVLVVVAQVLRSLRSPEGRDTWVRRGAAARATTRRWWHEWTQLSAGARLVGHALPGLLVFVPAMLFLESPAGHPVLAYVDVVLPWLLTALVLESARGRERVTRWLCRRLRTRARWVTLAFPVAAVLVLGTVVTPIFLAHIGKLHIVGPHDDGTAPDPPGWSTGSYPISPSASHSNVPRTVEGAGVLLGHQDSVRSIAFGQKGQILASGGTDATVQLWNTTRKEPSRDPFVGHTAPVVDIAINRDDTLVASTDGKTVTVWSVKDGHQITLDDEGAFFSVKDIAFSPSGPELAVSDAATGVQLWDPESGRPSGPAFGKDRSVEHIAFSPDGKALFSSYVFGGIQRWNPVAGQPVGDPYLPKEQVAHLAVSPDGTMLAVATSISGQVLLANAETGDLVRKPLTVKPSEHALTFAPDGHLLAVTSGTAVSLWDTNALREVRRVKTSHKSYVQGVAISPDGRLLATCSQEDSRVYLWSIDDVR